MSIVSIYVVFANDEEARRIGRQMIEEGHAACVNILGPCHSIYRWQGAIQDAEEIAAIFKTAADSAQTLSSRIEKLHSYETPAIVAWPAGGASAAYANWVEDNSR